MPLKEGELIAKLRKDVTPAKVVVRKALKTGYEAFAGMTFWGFCNWFRR
jgi:hypothetical protein